MGTELSATHMDLDTSGIQNTKGPFTDIDDFLSAVKNAQAGDLVILANGSYNVSSNKDTSFSKRKGIVNNDGALTLRHGDSTAVLGNYFEGNNGLRVGGADNLIANNHFMRNSNANGNRRPLVMMNGNKERPNEQGANNERVVNNDIILNTFANTDGRAKQIVRWGSKDLPKKPTGNRFRGNIITAQNGMLLKFDNGATASGNTITDNIGFVTGSADFGDLKTEMATRIDPLLTRDSDDGISQLQSGSPARGKIQGTPFSSLATVDIYGVDRSGNTDAGCHQHSTSSTRPKKRITKEDIGPRATTSLGGSPAWNPHPQIS